MLFLIILAVSAVQLRVAEVPRCRLSLRQVPRRDRAPADAAAPLPLRRAAACSAASAPSLSWLVVIAGALAMVIPFLWMLGVAFRTSGRPLRRPGPHPAGPVDARTASRRCSTQLPFARLVVNTFVFAGGTTLLLLLFDSMTAFALARLQFRGQNAVFVLILATLMVPFQVTLVPVFLHPVPPGLARTATRA